MTYAVLIAAAIFGSAANANTPVCYIEGAQDNLAHCLEAPCSTTERTRTVRFPDGREVSVVGHNHGDRTMSPKLAERLFMSSNTEMPVDLLKSIRESQPTNAQHAIVDSEFLKDYLQQHDEPVFIGVETSDSNLAYHLRRWSGLKDRLALWDRTYAPKDVEQAKQTIRQVLNPNLYLYVTNPELFKDAYLKGFELQALGTNEERLEKYCADLYARLEKAYQNDPKGLRDLYDTAQALVVMNESYDPPRDRAKTLETARDNPDISAEHRTLLFQWISAELARLDVRVMRDRVTSFNMVKEKRSGVLFVGENHLNAIARFLSEDCLREKKALTSAPAAARSASHPFVVDASEARH